MRKYKTKKGEAGLTSLYNKYKWSAKRKKHSFRLSKKTFKILTSSNCYYCGQEPKNIRTMTGKKGLSLEAKEYSKYYFNGLDRKNNNKGYTKDNVVPCCSSCNFLKGNRNYEEFLARVFKISKYIESVFYGD